MDKLIQALWSMCRLRLAPQDLPASYVLVAFTLAAYTFVSFLMGLSQLPWAQALLAGLIDVGLLALLSYLVLWIRLLTVRWYQTVAALAGTGALIGSLMLPFSYLQAMAGESAAAFLPSVAIIALLVWTLFVVAHILRHALDVPLLLGSALAGLYMYISLRVIGTLFFAAPR